MVTVKQPAKRFLCRYVISSDSSRHAPPSAAALKAAPEGFGAAPSKRHGSSTESVFRTAWCAKCTSCGYMSYMCITAVTVTTAFGNIKVHLP